MSKARSMSAFSNKKTQEEILEDLCNQIDSAGSSPELILYTAENQFFWYISKYLKQKYPASITMGSTTCYNFTDKGYDSAGASALVIFDGIECTCGALFEVNRHPMNYVMHVRNAVDSLSSYDNTCCVEFCTSYSLGEEIVLDTFEEGFSGKNIPVVGSSSGSTDYGTETFVALNGEMYKNTCVFCLIHNLEGRIFFYRENIYKPTEHTFITTDVDCEDRRVYEFNNKPAADALTEVLNVSLEELPDVLESVHLGRIVNGEIFITAASEISDDGSIQYYSRIYNRTKVVLLENDDVEKVWKETAENVKAVIPSPSFSLAVNCAGRSQFFVRKGMFGDYVNFLTENYGCFMGISGFGEQMKYTHFNQSMVIVVFE